ERFADRFAHFNFRDHMLRPCYGLAEATVFVGSGTWSDAADDSWGAVRFGVDELSAGRAQRNTSGTSSALV
ncbi:acyl-CoA synthetase, partial [Mycobacterium sp. ITM-2017-0098]